MGRVAELRRRPSAMAALRVLTLQRCAAAFLVILSYGALMWVMYSVWLRDVNPEEDLRRGPATLPVDYEAYRTSERARAAHRTASVRELSGEEYSELSGVGLREHRVGTVEYRVDETAVINRDATSAAWNEDTTGLQSETDFEDNLVEGFDDEGEKVTFEEDFDDEGEEVTFDEDEEEEEEDEDEEEEDNEDEEDTESPPNRRLLVFSSVPHSGSEVITMLLRWLASQNGFQFSQLRTLTTTPGPLDPAQQRRLVRQMTALSDAGSDGACVSHSEYVMDFSEHYGGAPPLRFSLIRDPIDRIMARFSHGRVSAGYTPSPAAAAGWSLTLEDCLRTSGAECSYMNGHQYPELTVPFFCGHHAECTRHNSRWALERAKRTVERRFTAVGVLEHVNTTLAVAETLLPRYFAGAWDRLFVDLVGEIGLPKMRSSPDELSQEARAVLRANLTTEYEFYDFVKQRVEQQYIAFVPGS